MLTLIVKYFVVYKKYLGARLYIVFVLSGVAAAAEGIGIAMLLPLLAAADLNLGGEAMAPTGVTVALQSILNMLGVGTSLIRILCLIAVIFVIKGCILFAASAYQAHLQSTLLGELKTLLFDQYSRMSYEYYCHRNLGHCVNVINTQVSALISCFNNYKTFLTIVISTLIYLLTAFVLAWDFALMAVIAGFMLLFVFRSLNIYVHHISRKTAREHSNLNKFLLQTLGAFKYLAATAELTHLRSGLVHSINKLSTYIRRKRVAQALTTSFSEPIAIVFVLFVIILQIVVFETPLTLMFVSLVLFNRALGSMMNIQKAWQQTVSQAGSLEMVEAELHDLRNHREPSGGLLLDRFSQGIDFDDVCYSYATDLPSVLRNVSFRIPANQTVAFVGESGSGKSTMVDVMTLMLKPQSGCIYIDGKAGADIDLVSWRRQIGYVSQETVIFDDTIANNICLWKDNYLSDIDARDRIQAAAKMANAHDFIGALPEGYNTHVGDRGVRLSGGQRQRIFLARELYKRPSLLILDEATSALDSESEHFIQQSIDALKGKMTVVIVAHRLATVKNADYIYVLDKGVIVESGTFKDLLSVDKGYFAEMVRLQRL